MTIVKAAVRRECDMTIIDSGLFHRCGYNHREWVTRESMLKPPEPINQVGGSMTDVRIRGRTVEVTPLLQLQGINNIYSVPWDTKVSRVVESGMGCDAQLRTTVAPTGLPLKRQYLDTWASGKLAMTIQGLIIENREDDGLLYLLHVHQSLKGHKLDALWKYIHI
ncbi:uncharacterized protein AFUA_2G08030 [Aspergillus fumigatus Af293]|uniref:Uncharacterized protein n=1 Tax=Aspergillus fumigatus (strain ATCC MYA-4609 / CBS 101355 / FGSC A1100 / Af293) TaxID=330879 RepID=Q4X215_ASPFU|nr:hypothetical protein AFUA_2G08030 [Aspergillus fumigatus Af293]EAL93100.1 hypothetical protein AFUA_2G08030 [Aspergillus fumigatus Af293]